jgi:hypothetical protein
VNGAELRWGVPESLTFGVGVGVTYNTDYFDRRGYSRQAVFLARKQFKQSLSD